MTDILCADCAYKSDEHCPDCEAEARLHERTMAIAFLRKPSEYGDPCSADREVLACQIERGEHLK